MTAKSVEVVICRACVCECKEYKSLYKQGLLMGEVTTLASLLSFCTNLEFVEDENSEMPSSICTNCVQDLTKSYIFKKKVLQANEILSGNLIENDAVVVREERRESKESVIVINEAEADLQELAEAAQMKREQLEQQIYEDNENETDNGEEYLQLTVLDNECEAESQQHHEEEHDQEEIEMEYMEQDVAETTEIYHTTIITEDMQHLEETEVIEQEQDQQQHNQHDDVEYEIQVNDIEEEYTEILTDSQDGMSQQSNKRSLEDAVNSGSEASIGNPSRRRRVGLNGKPPNPDFQCKVCGKQLSNSNSFKYHMKLHSDETPYKCEVCGDAFKTRNAYDGHISIHNPNNPNTCKLCGKSYRQASSLRMHMLTHSGIKPFTCEICGKSLTQKSGYKKHMVTHTGEKPYSCDICGKSFCFSSNMWVHRRSHTDQKQHQCTECVKCFLTVDQLRRHAIIHSDEKPFTCNVCGKQFKRQNAWRSHLQTHQESTKPEKQQFDLMYSDEYDESNREKSTVVEIF